VGKIARLLGKPFMPHQQLVADVALEVDPVTGRLVYDEYALLLPRQEGKSTFVEAKAAHRCTATGFFGPRQHVVYTAQTRKKALEKWEEDFRPDFEASSYFRTRCTAHKPPGNEHFRFANGSRWGLEASTETAGHGPTIDEWYSDEAFAHQDWRLEQALGPAMITRANKQFGVISTAGWLDGSPYLSAKVESGRAAVLDGRQSGRAYFEWSADADADPGDEGTWWRCMPALGRTITPAAIRSEYLKAAEQGKLNEFRRAYLNQWVPRDVADSWLVIPAAVWGNLADPRSLPEPPVVFAVAVPADRSYAAVGVAGRRRDGLLHAEVAEYAPGTAWVEGWLADRWARHSPAVVVLDKTGHEASFIRGLTDAGVALLHPSSQQVAAAYGQFYDAVVNGQLRHAGQPELDAAVAGAITRDVGDGGRTWGRRVSAADISPLVAVTLALWGFGERGPSGDVGAWVL
jgi:hypothetical protein